MTYHRCITAAFGNLCFTDIVDDIQIIMRHFTDKYIGPVVTGQSNLFPRRKFQTAMSSDMHQSICLESMPQIEIGCNISVRRRCFYPVNKFIFICAFPGERLRH